MGLLSPVVPRTPSFFRFRLKVNLMRKVCQVFPRLTIPMFMRLSRVWPLPSAEPWSDGGREIWLSRGTGAGSERCATGGCPWRRGRRRSKAT